MFRKLQDLVYSAVLNAENHSKEEEIKFHVCHKTHIKIEK